MSVFKQGTYILSLKPSNSPFLHLGPCEEYGRNGTIALQGSGSQEAVLPEAIAAKSLWLVQAGAPLNEQGTWLEPLSSLLRARQGDRPSCFNAFY